jgi:hypothetical protein
MSPADKIREDFLSEEFIIEFTGYGKRHIQNLRYRGSDKVPPHKKVGAKYVYPVKEFNAWVAKQPMKRGIA